MKTCYWRYKDSQDRKIPDAALLLSVGQYIYLDWQPRTTSAAERQATESYNQWMSHKTGTFKVIQLSSKTIRIDGGRIRNTVSIDQTTLAPLMKFAERQLLYMSDESVDKQDDRIDKGGGKSTAEAFADRPWEYPVYCIVGHEGEGHSARYILPGYGYAPAGHMVEPPEHTSENFITCYWC